MNGNVYCVFRIGVPRGWELPQFEDRFTFRDLKLFSFDSEERTYEEMVTIAIRKTATAVLEDRKNNGTIRSPCFLRKLVTAFIAVEFFVRESGGVRVFQNAEMGDLLLKGTTVFPDPTVIITVCAVPHREAREAVRSAASVMVDRIKSVGTVEYEEL